MSDNIYVSLQEAVAELKRRRNDKELRLKIESLLKYDIPNLLSPESGLHSILFRHIITPDLETSEFLAQSAENELVPCCLEYYDDLFIAENEDKHALGKLYFYLNTSKTGEINNFSLRIIDFALAQKKKIKEVATINDEKLVDFHHRILRHYYPDIEDYIIDASSWFKEHGPKAIEYYTDLFLLAVFHGILFENFRHDQGNEDWFMQNIALPARDRVYELTGLKPLICPIIDVQEENHPKWMGYDKDRKKFIVDSLGGV